MMPLWLFLLGRWYIDPDQVQIPYTNILITLASLTGPTLLGVLLSQFKKNVAKKLGKLIRPASLLFIIFVFSLGTYVNFYMYELMGVYPVIIPCGALLPWAGFAAGYLISFALRQEQKRRVTIALETGIQNIGIALVIMQFSLPQPDGDLGAVMPIITAIFTPLPLYIILAVMTIRNRCFKKGEKELEAMSEKKLNEEQTTMEVYSKGDEAESESKFINS